MHVSCCKLEASQLNGRGWLLQLDIYSRAQIEKHLPLLAGASFVWERERVRSDHEQTFWWQRARKHVLHDCRGPSKVVACLNSTCRLCLSLSWSWVHLSELQVAPQAWQMQWGLSPLRVWSSQLTRQFEWYNLWKGVGQVTHPSPLSQHLHCWKMPNAGLNFPWLTSFSMTASLGASIFKHKNCWKMYGKMPKLKWLLNTLESGGTCFCAIDILTIVITGPFAWHLVMKFGIWCELRDEIRRLLGHLRLGMDQSYDNHSCLHWAVQPFMHRGAKYQQSLLYRQPTRLWRSWLPDSNDSTETDGLDNLSRGGELQFRQFFTWSLQLHVSTAWEANLWPCISNAQVIWRHSATWPSVRKPPSWVWPWFLICEPHLIFILSCFCLCRFVLICASCLTRDGLCCLWILHIVVILSYNVMLMCFK